MVSQIEKKITCISNDTDMRFSRFLSPLSDDYTSISAYFFKYAEIVSFFSVISRSQPCMTPFPPS